MIALIGLAGHAGSGKDTAASMLHCKTFSFAEPLKRFCKEVFDFTDEQVFGGSEHRNRPDPRYTRLDGEPLTPRYALQQLGTEWGRSCHPNIWAELGVRRAVQYLASRPDTDIEFYPPLAVITDCRFPNEAKAIRDAGGFVWKIVRPGLVQAPEVASHPSETAMDTPEFNALVDRRIINDGTLEQLRAAVRFAAKMLELDAFQAGVSRSMARFG